MKNNKENKKNNIINLVAYFCILGLLLYLIGFMYNTLSGMDDSKQEANTKEYLEEKDKFFNEFKKGFIPGDENTYLVTDKYVSNIDDKIDGNVISFVRYKKVILTMKDNLTNKVYEVEVSRDFYHQTAVGKEFAVIESKNGKLLKIQETGDVFEKGTLLSKGK